MASWRAHTGAADSGFLTRVGCGRNDIFFVAADAHDNVRMGAHHDRKYLRALDLSALLASDHLLGSWLAGKTPMLAPKKVGLEKFS